MMSFMSLGLAVVLVVTIIYLWLSQREILLLRECCKEKEEKLPNPKQNDEKKDLSFDALTIHDKVMEMHAFGESVETIAQRLKIPQSQVEMTLKFEKIKNDSTP